VIKINTHRYRIIDKKVIVVESKGTDGVAESEFAYKGE